MSRFMNVYVNDVESLIESCIYDNDHFVLMEADGDNPGSDKNVGILTRIFNFISKIIDKIVGIIKKIFMKIRQFFTGKTGSDFRLGGLNFLPYHGNSCLNRYNHLLYQFGQLTGKIFYPNPDMKADMVRVAEKEFDDCYNEIMADAKKCASMEDDLNNCTQIIHNASMEVQLANLTQTYNSESKAIKANCNQTLRDLTVRAHRYSDDGSPLSAADACAKMQKYTNDIIQLAVKDAATMNKAVLYVKRDADNGDIKPASTHYYDGTGAHEILP